MVPKQQNEVADCKNAVEEVKPIAPCTWTFLWDNFNKAHDSHSGINDNSNTNSLKTINPAAIALSPPKSCQNKTCQSPFYWKKERILVSMNYI